MARPHARRTLARPLTRRTSQAHVAERRSPVVRGEGRQGHRARGSGQIPLARCAPPWPTAAHDHTRRDSSDGQGEGERSFSPDRQSLPRARASRIEASSRTLAMDRQGAGRAALSRSETACALAQQRGGFEALERVATAPETARALCARDRLEASQRASATVVGDRSCTVTYTPLSQQSRAKLDL